MSTNDFPDVIVLPALPKGHLAVYRERAQPPRIELSEALRMADSKTRRYVVFHEIGHWFRREHVPGTLSRAAEERFAHSFASFMLAPSAFAASEPDEHAKMATIIEPKNRRQIAVFARRLASRLRERR